MGHIASSTYNKSTIIEVTEFGTWTYERGQEASQHRRPIVREDYAPTTGNGRHLTPAWG